MGFAAVALLLFLQLLMGAVSWALWKKHRLRGLDEQSAYREAQQHLNQESRQIMQEWVAREMAATRLELNAALSEMGRTLVQQMGAVANMQHQQMDLFAQHVGQLKETTERSLEAVRETLARQLRDLQVDNAAKLERVRQTVDEKLQSTLELRLNASFAQVADRLEKVHRGLGEMQIMAADVGDLRRVLTNVKVRGTWGEVQLAALLEQLLAPDQYASNVAPVPGSAARVEFGVRLPSKEGECVWLPIDAKFPREDYERLLLANEKGDAEGAELAGKQLEQRIRQEARTIQKKYISPPATSDFALMFLPTEGLYAEVIRRPGLVDDVQRNCRVLIAGPCTLAALLSSLQMGFRALAVGKRSSEVWKLLGAVKTEFQKFGDILGKAKEQIDRASATIGTTAVRTRAIQRHLRAVEFLPAAGAEATLGVEASLPEEDA